MYIFSHRLCACMCVSAVAIRPAIHPAIRLPTERFVFVNVFSLLVHWFFPREEIQNSKRGNIEILILIA